MSKCGIDGCDREAQYGKALCRNCWSVKKFRLQHWRKVMSEQRKVRKAEEKRLKARENRIKRAEADLKQDPLKLVYLSNIRTRYAGGKSGAVRRGLNWTLSYEQYHALVWPGVCFYCKQPNIKSGVGLDRCDNSRDYTPDNVVACCGPCNTIKGEHLTFDEMVAVSTLLNAMRTVPAQEAL